MGHIEGRRYDELSIDEKRYQSNDFRINPDTNMTFSVNGRRMTHAQWLERGRDIGIRARVRLMESGIPTGRTARQDRQDYYDFRAMEQRIKSRDHYDRCLSEAWDAAHQEATERADLSVAQQRIRSAFDAEAARHGRHDHIVSVGQLAALQTLAHDPESVTAKELASHIVGAGYLVPPRLPDITA